MNTSKEMSCCHVLHNRICQPVLVLKPTVKVGDAARKYSRTQATEGVRGACRGATEGMKNTEKAWRRKGNFSEKQRELSRNVDMCSSVG